MMNIELINPQDLTIAKFLALFNQFTRAEQVQIARTIWEKAFAEQWRQSDAELPNIEISEEEVLADLMSVRYGEAAKALGHPRHELVY